MKILKYILGIILVIVVIFLVVAAFTPNEYAVEREITINRPVVEVFDYVKLLKNQDNYSKWATMDTDMKKTFTGVDGTVGFVSAWESNNKDVGKGEQEIMKIDEGKRIDFELRFIEPFEANDNAFMITEAIDTTATIVKWGFDGKMDYPMNIMLLAMDMEKMLGDDLQEGLNKLKIILEEKK